MLHKLIIALAIGSVVALGCGPGVEVTGENIADPTWLEQQAEAVINVSNFGGGRVVTVTYNDQTTDPNVVFTPTTRTIFPGASELGWSYSLDNGQSFTYGGKVFPPSGQSVLWGDPSIASWRMDQRYVFIANLSVSENSLPVGSSINGSIGPFLDGACIARSTDGGITFQNLECITDNNHFYDGTSLAITEMGVIWFATRDADISENKADVWRSAGLNGSFTQVPTPFPGAFIVTHPRLRVQGNTVYVMAVDNTGRLWLTRWLGSSWQSPLTLASTAAVAADQALSDRTLRAAGQFAFDIGGTQAPDEELGLPCEIQADCGEWTVCSNQSHICIPGDTVRVLYTSFDATQVPSNQFSLRTIICDVNLQFCREVLEWSTGPFGAQLPGNQFNPLLVAWDGTFISPPAWRAAFLSRQDAPNGNTVSVEQARIWIGLGGDPLFFPSTLIPSQEVCSTKGPADSSISNNGYWGDYNDIKVLGVTNLGLPRYITVFTDSRKGCPDQFYWSAHRMHVGSIVF